MNTNSIEETIRSAITLGDTMLLREGAYAMKADILSAGYISEQRFNFLIGLLDDQEFLNLGGGWCFIIVLGRNEELLSDDQKQKLLPAIRFAYEAFDLEFEWELLSDSQKERLLPALETSYAAFTDWMCWFDISVLLGEYFADERALQILCRLKTIQAEEPRSLVPHGLEHIISDSGDDRLAKKAYAELLATKNDPSEKVRDTVDNSLRIAAKFVIKYENCP